MVAISADCQYSSEVNRSYRPESSLLMQGTCLLCREREMRKAKMEWLWQVGEGWDPLAERCESADILVPQDTPENQCGPESGSKSFCDSSRFSGVSGGHNTEHTTLILGLLHMMCGRSIAGQMCPQLMGLQKGWLLDYQGTMWGFAYVNCPVAESHGIMSPWGQRFGFISEDKDPGSSPSNAASTHSPVQIRTFFALWLRDNPQQMWSPWVIKFPGRLGCQCISL